MTTFRAIIKTFLLSVIVVIVGLLIFSFFDTKEKKAQVITPTPELLIIPATATPTATPIGAELSRTLTAIAIQPTNTPQRIRNAQIPIYNGNGELIGYMTTPTATKICLNIKGNVNSRGEKIYHCQHWRDYDSTEIISAEGDRYFCSEGEARAAGFRAAEYPHGICR